jgi:hypothetical protein
MFQPVAEVLADPLSPSSTHSGTRVRATPDGSGPPALCRRPRTAPPWPFRSRVPGEAGSLTPQPPALTGAADMTPEMGPDSPPDRPQWGAIFPGGL